MPTAQITEEERDQAVRDFYGLGENVDLEYVDDDDDDFETDIEDDDDDIIEDDDEEDYTF